MPNHVQTCMKVVSGDANKFFDAIRGETELDFEKIIPSPEIFKHCFSSQGGIVCSLTDAAEAAMFRAGFKVIDYMGNPLSRISTTLNFPQTNSWPEDWWPQFVAMCKAIQETGFSNSLDWNIVHWGTKWNAYDVFRKEKTLWFQTAWSLPEPILRELAKMFPSIVIRGKYADEDKGSNCGTFKIQSGELSVKPLQGYNEKAKKFACSVWGYDYDKYVKDREEE